MLGKLVMRTGAGDYAKSNGSFLAVSAFFVGVALYISFLLRKSLLKLEDTVSGIICPLLGEGGAEGSCRFSQETCSTGSEIILFISS